MVLYDYAGRIHFFAFLKDKSHPFTLVGLIEIQYLERMHNKIFGFQYVGILEFEAHFSKCHPLQESESSYVDPPPRDLTLPFTPRHLQWSHGVMHISCGVFWNTAHSRQAYRSNFACMFYNITSGMQVYKEASKQFCMHR